ncbi:MAG: AMP-binding protein [Kiritimatiellae bacterium]|nr:AMP-binding protein [Kiritimatiellia bacterium]
MIATFLDRTDYDGYDDFLRNYRVNVPPAFNFAFDVVDAIAARDPARRALVWCNDAGEERAFDMLDMARDSNRIANYFSGLGIRKGDRVMLILRRHHRYWPALLALHRLGAVAIPATNMLMRKDIVYRVKAAGIKMIVAVDEPHAQQAVNEAMDEAPVPLRLQVGGRAGSGWLDLEAGLRDVPDRFARPTGAQAHAPNDPMLLYFTSGTTGMPKMVQHDFRYPLGHIHTAWFWQGCRPGGLHLTVAETGWAKASWGKIYGQWIAGSAVMVYDMDRFVPRKVLETMVRCGVTTFCAPPTMYRYFIREPLRDYDWSKLRQATVAGEPLNPEVFEQFKAATGLELREGYGQTETTPLVATYPWLKPKPGSMGRPSPGYHIDIARHDGSACDVGEEGEIVIRTAAGVPPGVFQGYANDPALTASVWHDGIYHTGDVAWRDEDGYFWFVGRDDDMIKSSGYRIGPFEVESALQEHPAVLECAVTGVPDPERGLAVKATIVLSAGHVPSEALKKELQEHVKHTTAPYKYPRVIEFVSELPKTISGKIRRVEIRARHKSH